MNILHLSTFQHQGGAAIAAGRLHQALLKEGINSHLFVQKGTGEGSQVNNWDHSYWKKKWYWSYFIGERLYFMPYEKDKSVRYAFSPAQIGMDISRHPLVQQADIIHLHWINFGFLSLKSIQQLVTLGKPIVWTMHDMWAFTGGCHYSRSCTNFQKTCKLCPYLKRPSQQDLSFRIFEQKKAIYNTNNLTLVAPSKWLQQLATSATLTKDLSCKVIPNPIDTTFYQPQSKAILRKDLGLPIDKKLILFVGANTMDPRKGFNYFREATNQLHSSDSSFEIVVFGKTQESLENLLTAKVHNLGPIYDAQRIAHLYSACDVLVAPSLEDNLPNTIMEAMACGTPVVGFATGGIPEMIDHLQNGYIAEHASSHSLEEGILWVLENSEKLPLYARQKVETTYTETVIAKQYLSLYTSLLSTT